MTGGVANYFEGTVMPMIRDRHSVISSEMSIIVLGSAGLGIDDEFSDLEAAIYLDDCVWREHGGWLQLSLNECIWETCPWKKQGSVISVMPLSSMLGGHAKNFLGNQTDPPWEEVSFGELFTIQKNRILYDPRQSLGRLRMATSPSRRPDHLWRKSLLLGLKKLIRDDLEELKSCVARERVAEVYILLGHVLQGLFHVGFMICRQYPRGVRTCIGHLVNSRHLRRTWLPELNLC